MALTDINFIAADNQEFIQEIPTGTLGTPSDIVIESGSANQVVTEVAGTGGGGNIFIMSE